MNDSCKILQVNLERLMIKNRLRMAHLAKKAKISKGLIWKLMTDKKPNPSLLTLDRLATALNVSTMELLRQ